LNIAWDPLVPPPPTGVTPEAIEDPNYVIPLIVGDLKDDMDKKGVASKVVDCVYSKELKSKASREPDFKQFLSYVALERVEEKHELRLSRQLATPNIASKGKLEPRSVIVPVYGPQARLHSAAVRPILTEDTSPTTSTTVPKKPLIEEVGSTAPAPSSTKTNGIASESKSRTPAWSLTTLKNDEIRLDLEMPDLTRELAAQATLDVEARRVILSAGSPPLYEFDQTFPDVKRDFRVDSARAEWNVASKKLSIFL